MPRIGQFVLFLMRLVAGTVLALVAAYLDCSPTSTSPFKRLARETQRTQRNILERFREAHGEKRIYATSLNGARKLLLTRHHVQRIVNAKSDKPSAQRNLLKTLHAVFKWALAEDRVPENPILGVTRQKIKSAGYRTWSEEDIAQYRRKHSLGSKARLALELALSTAGRRKDIVWLGPQHVEDGIVTFEQSKTEGTDEASVSIPLDPSFFEALAAMPSSKIVPLSAAPTFLTTDRGRAFASPESFGNWFRKCCDQAGLAKGLSLHGLRKATARRLAERGCSVHEIAAITGHASLSEIERYTKAADKKRLAIQAKKKLLADRT